MARKKTDPDVEHLKHMLARRLKEVRIELYGERGSAEWCKSPRCRPGRGPTTSGA